MNGRDQSGALACLSSVAKLPYEYSRDGISLTAAFTPSSLGKTKQDQIKNLTAMMDGYFKKGGYHLNTNVFNKETLLKVIESPGRLSKLHNSCIRIRCTSNQFNSRTTT